MSSAAFRDFCLTALTDADRALLPYCTLDPDPVSGPAEGGGPAYGEPFKPSSSDFIDRWRDWERVLRLNLARYRAQRLKREGNAPAEPPDCPADAAAAAKAASAMDSPLEAELFLDKSRWDAIEAFQGLDYFGRNTMYAYLLKLLLMERRSSFRSEEGLAEYKGLYAAIMDGGGAGEAGATIKPGEPK
jgi:hypothetical protein